MHIDEEEDNEEEEDNGDEGERIERLQRDLDFAERRGDPLAEGIACRALAGLYLAQGDQEQFLAHAKAAAVNFYNAHKPADQLEMLLWIRQSGIKLPTAIDCELMFVWFINRIVYAEADADARLATQEAFAMAEAIEKTEPALSAYFRGWISCQSENFAAGGRAFARSAELAPQDALGSWVTQTNAYGDAILCSAYAGESRFAQKLLERWENDGLKDSANEQMLRRVRFARALLAFQAQPELRHLRVLRSLRAEVIRAHESFLLIRIGLAELTVINPPQEEETIANALAILRVMPRIGNAYSTFYTYRKQLLVSSMRLYQLSRAVDWPYVELVLAIPPPASPSRPALRPAPPLLVARAERAVRRLERIAARMDYRTVSDACRALARRFRQRLQELSGQ